MLARAKLQFEGFDNTTQPHKPHWESMRPFFAFSYGNAAKEGLKRTTHWAAIYFTNPKSWYPVPERAMFLSAMPVIQPLPAVLMTPPCVQVMRDWSQTFGAAVRQRDNKGKSRNPALLPERGAAGWVFSLEPSWEQRENEAEEADEEDGILEYDSSSSEDLYDEQFSTKNDEADDDVGGILPLDREATVLLGTVSRFGRTVRFNSRIII